MEHFADFPITTMLIAANVVASLVALANPTFMNKNLFHVGPIVSQREYHRLLTSGFLHGGLLHLFVNMYVLWMFGSLIEYAFGANKYLIIYFAALLGGNLWSLMENRRKPEYRALGASGATSGIVMSFTLLAPFEKLYFFPLPIPFPAVVLAVIFIVASAILAQRENKVIGHEAHLGGALAGILATIAVEPRVLSHFSQQIASVLGGG
ncbi:MAG: rhomboid family intramembrane serine protease [Alphaproteobacteria bacterium]|nr:rhomboid family intramembrane serine protease [Alphaproteobacteria bacterium]